MTNLREVINKWLSDLPYIDDLVQAQVILMDMFKRQSGILKSVKAKMLDEIYVYRVQYYTDRGKLLVIDISYSNARAQYIVIGLEVTL